MSTQTISAADVKALRERTGAGMMDCKSALQEAGGDVEKAIEILRVKGQAQAAKRGGRAASEGAVESYIHAGGKIGVLVEVDCETDFVARTDDFKAFVRDVALHIAAAAPLFVSEEDVPADLRDKACLDDEEIRALARLGRQIEQHYGCPQDIEWAIARNGPPGAGVFLLQSRPETVWATKEKAPVAKPKARAFDHVLSRLGGAQ